MRLARSTACSAVALAVGITAALGAACSPAPVDGDGGPATAAVSSDVPPIELAGNFEATLWKLDPYTIDTARVDADTLTIVVRHGGGCGTHRFSLAASRAFRESNPVQVSAVLTHDAGGDACRALLTRTLRYDLSPLRTAYREAYHARSGAIVMHLWHQGRTLRYAF